MDSTIVYKTEKGNSYFLDANTGNFGVLSPKLYEQIMCQDTGMEQDVEVDSRNYYKRKHQYWLNHGLFQKQDLEEEVYLTPEMVEESLANTEQIVFEVTDKCNLRCKYCGYRDLYGGYDQRVNKNLSVEDAIRFWNQVYKVIEAKKSIRTNEKLVVGFYGGEPLLNFDFVRDMVDYIKSTSSVKIEFNMTTNAMLLDKYMDFLIKEDFSLLISLDGDYEGNSYRVTADHKNPHPKIVRNIDMLQEKSPEYFQRKVQFNAVLHDANSIDRTYHFIHTRYGKKPRMSEMSTDSIVKKDEYDKMKKSFVDDFVHSDHKEILFQAYFQDFPLHKDIDNLLRAVCNASVLSISDLLGGKPIRKLLTGTCLPFNKKVFITVNGKILACEKIDHIFFLAQLKGDGELFDFEFIANKYNEYYKKVKSRCSSCYYKKICDKCMFSVSEELNADNYACSVYMNKREYGDYMSYLTSFLEEYPVNLDQYVY